MSFNVDVQHLKYRVGAQSERLILDNVCIQTNSRRIGIVGRNGSGKTSLARLLCGLVEAAEGHVLLHGVNVFTQREQALRTVGLLFQNPDHQIIFPTVLEELNFGLLQLGSRPKEATIQSGEMLSRFGKQAWQKVNVAQLSQGQRQLVCLMAVLLMEPKVIVLDEPFSGLDIPTKRQLTRYLSAVDATLIHISHEPSVLRSYEQVLWLEQGKVIANGDAQATLQAFEMEMERLGEQDDIPDITD